MRNKYKGKCACGTSVEAGGGYLRDGKVRCESCSTFVIMPGNVVVPDTDDGYDQWRDELVARGTWGYGRKK